ncbi:MAG TPA: DEAD/DEAH box helicase [Acidimicrobiales bacterium]|nr:DEAD/DEAH box helicase [Acidimicrobiales bacterium]
MARARRPSDWERDLAEARPVERVVGEALRSHPEVSRLSDFTDEMELDFEFRFEGEHVNLEVKEKRQPLSGEYVALWPEVPAQELFVLDETAFRRLAWAQGMGYLVVHDEPLARWLYFGPWELALGPRRRFERLGDKGAGDFLKGKLLLDLRTAAAETAELRVGALLDVVRRSRGALHHVEAVRIRRGDELPTIPRRVAAAGPPARTRKLETAAPPQVGTTEVAGDRAWAGLSPEIVAGIRDRWGWEQPTPVQRKAIPPILHGDNVLVLGPTAGGKTEAALLPLLDRWHMERWAPISILALSPLKALLDDQLARYRRATALVGARAFAWHGDVRRADKRAFLDQPADVLLTTPESLELVLSSPAYDQRRLLARLQAVVVDEVHAFVGTARGAQLASLLERLDRFTTSDVQRVGLSATVGNPAEVLDWLGGGSHRSPVVASEAAPMQGEVLSIVSYDGLDEAVAAIGARTAGDRVLVFTRSRRRAEDLAGALAAPVHHSSLSSEERAATAAALATGEVPLVVATSSLELGIDVGDLDLVVHDGAPSGPAAYLQRLGRAGRRTGVRRMLFTTDEPDDLLLILAVLARVRRGDLESLPPGRGARLVLGQQALALAFERNVVDRRELFDALRWSPAFSSCVDAIEPVIDHLLHGGWLAAVGEQLVVGPVAQARFGGHRVGDLLATFEGSEGATVVDEEGHRVGTIDWDRVADDSKQWREGFRLAGRPWTVVAVDRQKGVVKVRSAERGKAPSWRGAALEVERATSEAAREVLVATDVPVEMDGRATGWLEQLRQEWSDRLADPVRSDGSTTVLDSFAGVAVHRAVLVALGLEGSAGGTTCEVAAPLGEVRRRAQACLDDLDGVLEAEAERQAAGLPVRHRDLVPPRVLVDEARSYHVDAEGVRRVLELPTRKATWPS